MALSIGTSGHGTANATSITVSLTLSTENLLVVAWECEFTAAFSTATYNGISLTQVTNSPVDDGGNREGGSLWYLVNPTTGSAQNLVVTLTTSRRQCVQALAFSGADTTTPINGTPDKLTDTGTTTPTVTTTGVSGEYIVQAMSSKLATTSTDPTPSNTLVFTDQNFTSSGCRGGMQYRAASGGADTLSWTLDASRPWAAINARVNPAPAANVVTPVDYSSQRMARYSSRVPVVRPVPVG